MKRRNPIAQLFRVRVFQAVLEIACGDAIFAVRSCTGCMKSDIAVYLGKLRWSRRITSEAEILRCSKGLRIDLMAAC